MVRETNKPGDEPEVNVPDTSVPEGYMSRDEVLALLEERDKQHAEDMAAVRARVPVAMVAANGGGPGVDQHQVSWSLAEQEAAQRGEVLDHWVTRD
jgi:hypothetical protein